MDVVIVAPDVAKRLVGQMPDVVTMVATLVVTTDVIQVVTTDVIQVVATPSQAVVARPLVDARKIVVVVCWTAC
ncbi:MAG: hypothetical protein GY768_07610 [Planctomycetaceae bacterium]|nr:hypothetical protein [Planctomycetaceae bacterium]